MFSLFNYSDSCEQVRVRAAMMPCLMNGGVMVVTDSMNTRYERTVLGSVLSGRDCGGTALLGEEERVYQETGRLCGIWTPALQMMEWVGVCWLGWFSGQGPES